MMEDFIYFPPYSFLHKIRTGAIQEHKCIKDNWDIIRYQGDYFFIWLSYHDNDKVIKKIIPEELAMTADWNKIIEWWDNLDNTKLPNRKDLEQKDLIELLLPFGIFKEENDPNVVINGQPRKNLVIDPEYVYKEG